MTTVPGFPRNSLESAYDPTMVFLGKPVGKRSRSASEPGFSRARGVATGWVLADPGGRPKVTLQLLCDGVPLRGLSQVDASTGRANVRFVAPHPGGRLTVRVANGDVGDGVYIQLERAELGPKDTWEGCREIGVVNEANVLFHGQSMTVERDESSGGRSILVEPLKDARGRAADEADAEARGLRRTKWRLGVRPRAGCGHEVYLSEWRLIDTKLGLREVPLHVKTSTADAILAVSDSVSFDWLKESVERELGIPCGEQRLRASDGSCPSKLADVLGRRFLALLVCGKQRVGANLWFWVQHSAGKEFVEALSTDTVGSVLARVRRHGSELDGLHLDDVALRTSRTLAEYNVACLDTLELREHGSVRVTVAVEYEDAAARPKTLVVGVNPEDTVAELQRRVALKAVAEPMKRRRLDYDGGVELRLGGVPLAGYRTVEDSGLTAATAHRPVRCLIPSYEHKMKIKIRTMTGKVLTVPCQPNYSIEMIKQMILDSEGTPHDQQRLVFAGRMLEDGRTLSDYNILRDDVLHLILRLRGGGGPDFIDALQVDEEVAPEGPQPIAAPAAGASAPASTLTVGKIWSGEVVPPQRTRACEFQVESSRECPWLQFDVFFQ